MAASENSPTEAGKNAKIVKSAQEQLDTMDVFVCGRCHSVFHFVEEFKSHKEKPCKKSQSNIRDCNESNAKIWAFLLWKEAQLQKKNGNNANRTSWALYQTWVKMDDSQRGTWVVAGKTIQSFSKVGKGSLSQMPVKITKTVVNNPKDGIANRKPLSQTKPQVANLKPPTRPVPKRTPAKGTENESVPAKTSPNPILQKVGVKQSIDTNASSNDKPLSRRAKRSVPDSTEIVDGYVEKIVAKRFNPRCKMHEYLVKWESAEIDQNTWEPATHLENVLHLVDTFEKQLARQKEIRAAMQAQQEAQAKMEEAKKDDGSTSASQTSPVATDNTRPLRNSKIKAMDQVKQWVSTGVSVSPAAASVSASPGDVNAEKDRNIVTGTITANGTIKRKLEESDSNNSNAVKFSSTIEDLEEDLIPSHTVKRLKNGSSVSVEVKTKTEKNVESKVIKVNGNGRTSVSGDSLPVGTDSADVIITQDANESGVVKKPGFENVKKSSQKPEGHIRVLTKSESAMSNSGIVRLNEEIKTPVRTQSIRVNSNGSNTTTVRQVAQRTTTPGGTTIQRKTGANNNGRTPLQPTVRTTAQPAPHPGRMFLSRQTTTTRPATATTTNKTVTPEQKILQLSKSGDLKVTKKVMTREDAVARMNPAQKQQRQQQQQSQVQIQKVQQISQNSNRGNAQISMSTRSKMGDEVHQAQLCPITGKLIGQDDSSGAPNAVQNQMHNEQQQQQIAFKQEPDQPLQNVDTALLLGNDQQMLTNEDGTPLLVTGEDGTVYQVAGKNAEGQTILVTQGPDGEQQFAYVAAAESDENQVMTLDNAVAEAVAQLPAEQQAEALAAAAGEGQYLVKTTQEDGTTQVVTMSEAELAQHQALAQQQISANSNSADATGQLCVQTEGGDGQEANIPAEVVQADLPSPGGTRRVVLLLQDGSYMMTEMHDDEFKALNIAT